MNNGDRRIVQPNETRIGFNFQEGPLAQPISVAVPVAGGLQVGVTGGLTKHQQLAGMILSGAAAHAQSPEHAQGMVHAAVTMADILLQLTGVRQQTAAPELAKPD